MCIWHNHVSLTLTLRRPALLAGAGGGSYTSVEGPSVPVHMGLVPENPSISPQWSCPHPTPTPPPPSPATLCAYLSLTMWLLATLSHRKQHRKQNLMEVNHDSPSFHQFNWLGADSMPGLPGIKVLSALASVSELTTGAPTVLCSVWLTIWSPPYCQAPSPRWSCSPAAHISFKMAP